MFPEHYSQQAFFSIGWHDALHEIFTVSKGRTETEPLHNIPFIYLFFAVAQCVPLSRLKGPRSHPKHCIKHRMVPRRR